MEPMKVFVRRLMRLVFDDLMQPLRLIRAEMSPDHWLALRKASIHSSRL